MRNHLPRNPSEVSVWRRSFLISVSFILVMTAMAKLVSAAGQAAILNELDPIFQLPFSTTMVGAGILELLVGVLCMSRKHQSLALSLTVWLSISFVTYRFGLWWIEWQRPCHCLGSLTEGIRISASMADNTMKVILFYMLGGSLTLLMQSTIQKRKQTL